MAHTQLKSSLQLNTKETYHEIFFSNETCRFEVGTVQQRIINDRELPLSVILQVTRHCNFSCVFCSEIEQIADPTLEEIERMRANLQGVPRVYISGGEPLLRKDLPEILDLFYADFVVGLPTNAVIRDPKLISILKERVDFVNVGLDGPRNITSRIRGNYDAIMEGIRIFQHHDIPISLSCVVLSSTKHSILLTCQIADLIGAKKLKLILPIPKGNALNLPESEYLTSTEAGSLFTEVKRAKDEFGWKTKITLTTWCPRVEGYSILVFPDGSTYTWPVYSQPNHVQLLGNLINDPIQAMWQQNPYKQNHYDKYLGKSIFVA